MLDESALRTLFFDARTFNAFRPDPIDPALLEKLYETCRWAPTAANTNPGRVLFVRSKEAKEKLRPALDAGNVDKTMRAPVTAVMACDLKFYEHLEVLMPPMMPKLRETFEANPSRAESNARFSGTLFIGYFLLTARALGLDCGPMAGFDSAKVDAAFFGGQSWRSLLLINLGHGDAESGLYPRNPRLSFEQACSIV